MRNSKPKYMVRASAVNSLSIQQDSLISVIASQSFSMPEHVEMSAFGCHHCGTSFAALKGIEPFCVTCGSDDVELDDDQPLAPEVVHEDQELSGIICAGCGSNNIVTDVVAAKLGGKLHCVTCGEGVEYNAPEVDNELPEVNPLDAQSGDDEFDGELSLDEDLAAKVDGTDEDLAPAQSADAPGATTVPAEVEPMVAADVEPDLDAETVDVPMTDAIPEDDDDDFDVSVDDDAMVATVNSVPVAMLARSNAGEYADVWGKTSLMRAVRAAVSAGNRNEALAAFGFTPIVAKFPLKSLVDKAVTAALEGERKQVVASVANLRADYTQSLAIAAAGLQKGFFKGKEHPIKAALFDELNAAGVRNPARLIDKVFAAAGASFLGTLLDTAEEVMAKSLDLRNELAGAIDCTDYIPVADDDSQEDDDEADAALARMQTHAGLRVTAAVSEPASVRPAQGVRLFGNDR